MITTERSLILLLFAIAMMMPASAEYSHYRRKAAEQMAWVQNNLYDPASGLYHAAIPRAENSLPYDFMWGNGVQFTALVAATRNDPKRWKPTLYAFAGGLKRYWDKDADIPGFDAYFSSPGRSDKYYDDNQWLVLGFTEAYQVTGDTFFLDWARDTQDFVLSGWDDALGGGIYWHDSHQSKNTCSNAPAAAAALRLYRVGRTKEDRAQLEWALRIRHWLNAHLKDADGLYWDNVHLDGRIERTKWTYNTALPIRVDTLLYEATGVKPYLAEARRMADAAIAEWVNPKTGAIRDTPKFTHLLCEALLGLHEVTREPKYLNVVRRYADFADAHGRHPDGGFREHFERESKPGEPRLMIENAAMARLFWLLAPYPSADELVSVAKKRMADREWDRAEPLLRQAVETAPRHTEARLRFIETLRRRGKVDEAGAEEARLREVARAAGAAGTPARSTPPPAEE